VTGPGRPPREIGPARPGPIPFLTLVTVANLSILLFELDRQSLWADEVMSLEVARSSVAEMARYFRIVPEQHPLYYLLLKAWIFFGTSESALRLFSVLFGAASLWMLYFLTRALFDDVLARLSTVLLGFSPFYLYFGQEARMYTLLGFLAIASSYLFIGFTRTPSRMWAAGYVVSGILGVYTHVFFFFALAAHWTFLLLRDRRLGPALLRTTLCHAVIVLCYSPWALLLWSHRPPGQTWKGAQHVLFGIPYTLLRFSLGYSEVIANYRWQERVTELLLDSAALLVLSVLLFGLLALCGIAWMRRAGSPGLFVLCGLLAPMAIAQVVSLKVILMGERYFIVSFPFYVILLAAGMRWLWDGGRALRVLALVTLLVYGGVAGRCLVDYFANPEFGKEQWREVATYVSERAEARDMLLFHGGYALEAFRYYYGRSHTLRTSFDVTARELAEQDRIWLIIAHAGDGDRYWRSLTTTHQAATNRLFPRESGIRLLLLLRRPVP
jgi:4-amino-4-deoxy-L-arabinose transferase-like glycosyltransferase